VVTKYIADPSEISVCDRPCSPSCTYDVVKLGKSERRHFPSPIAASARKDVAGLLLATVAGELRKASSAHSLSVRRVNPNLAYIHRS